MEINRRYFCTASAALLWSCSGKKNAITPDSFVPAVDVFDNRFYDVISPNSKVQIVATGFQWSEGPSWDLGKDVLYFTDVPKNEAYIWSKSTGLNVFLNPSGAANLEGFREPGANGLFYDYDSRLLLCNHGRRSIEHVSKNGKVRETLIDRFKGKKFNSPNDIIAARDGHLFFTDPPYGLDGLNASKLKDLNFNGVYHLSPNGDVKLIDRGMTFPNGLAISQDHKTLYVSQSDPDNPIIIRFELDESYNVLGKSVFFDFAPFLGEDAHGLPDGMTLDASGNLITTGPGGIYVINPAGEAFGRIRVDRASSNCTFGEDGTVLFVTNQDRLLRIETQTLGDRWVEI